MGCVSVQLLYSAQLEAARESISAGLHTVPEIQLRHLQLVRVSRPAALFELVCRGVGCHVPWAHRVNRGSHKRLRPFPLSIVAATRTCTAPLPRAGTNTNWLAPPTPPLR